MTPDGSESVLSSWVTGGPSVRHVKTPGYARFKNRSMPKAHVKAVSPVIRPRMLQPLESRLVDDLLLPPTT